MQQDKVTEALHDVGHMIDTDAMSGRSANGNFDTSDVLEKSEEIFEYLMDFMIDHVKERVQELLDDNTDRIVGAETYDTLQELRKDNSELDTALKDVDKNYASEIVKNLSVTFDTHITHKQRYNNL